MHLFFWAAGLSARSQLICTRFAPIVLTALFRDWTCSIDMKREENAEMRGIGIKIFHREKGNCWRCAAEWPDNSADGAKAVLRMHSGCRKSTLQTEPETNWFRCFLISSLFLRRMKTLTKRHIPADSLWLHRKSGMLLSTLNLPLLDKPVNREINWHKKNPASQSINRFDFVHQNWQVFEPLVETSIELYLSVPRCDLCSAFYGIFTMHSAH